MKKMKMRKRLIFLVLLTSFSLFMLYRFVRPLSIFVVTKAFERPIPAGKLPTGLVSLSARECGKCHREIFEEWSGSIHARAWTDPYFQADTRFDGSQQICMNCHIPLENQQENRVLGFRDRDKLDPILRPNPDFDPELQKEGVTCAVCHVTDGVILGPRESGDAPHPVRKDPRFTDGSSVCRRCHLVSGRRWDTFYRLPPCGTFREIKEAGSRKAGCTGCHMPEEKEENGHAHHLWRGGHDPAMIRQALTVMVEENPSPRRNRKKYTLTLTNTGTDHFLPTGTPDRHLSVTFTLTDGRKDVLKEKTFMLKRHIMWRPFIADLWDTRLPKGKPRDYTFAFQTDTTPRPAALKIVVKYHLLDEKRRARIGYENKEPIAYTLYEKNLPID
ncbi:MAG: hypothetical protein GXP58_03475 [Deltaproteobacteria bacterium]|nr:hypothetical protein [Deltaproteobacteria bacterium]